MKRKSLEYLERVSLDHRNTAVFKSHLARYKFAEKFVKNRIVLDTGCGTGYGSEYLSRCASEVIGVDNLPEAINYARRHFQNENLKYQIMDCTAMAFKGDFFDVVCAFELLEHVPKYEKLVCEIERVLKLNGIALISTPNKGIFSPEGNPPNPHHFKEFCLGELNEFLLKYFSEVKIYGQKGSQKVEEVFHGGKLKHFLDRLDFLRIHDLIPRRLYCAISGFLGFAVEEDITLADYSIFSESELERAETFVAMCKK